MSETDSLTLHLPGEAATVALGARLAEGLTPGMTVYLIGELGAGKSALARAMIQAVCGGNETVPSPTFTLMQEYEAPFGRIIHADLYRLSEPEELDELGLEDAFSEAAVLIEWPERLEGRGPPDRLDVQLSIAEDGGRGVHLTATGPLAQELLVSAMRPREDLMDGFLLRADWQNAERKPLAGDASNRRYLRLSRDGEPAVLMDSPPEKGEDVRPFVAVTDLLRERGLSAPDLFARDETQGFLLLEDLGDAIYARVCEGDPALERPLYEAAVDVIAGLKVDGADLAPPYDAAVLEREAALLTDWWVPDASPDLRAEYLGLIAEATTDVETDRSALVLRDYHAENLIWLPEREGLARVGLLDYQDALLGHPAYDLMSLLEDARRDVAPELAEVMIRRFLAARPDLGADAFRAGYDALGAQRNAKIIGIFARLSLRDGKPRYIDLIPRVWAHFRRDLSSPHLGALRAFVDKHIPAPTPEILARMRAA